MTQIARLFGVKPVVLPSTHVRPLTSFFEKANWWLLVGMWIRQYNVHWQKKFIRENGKCKMFFLICKWIQQEIHWNFVWASLLTPGIKISYCTQYCDEETEFSWRNFFYSSFLSSSFQRGETAHHVCELVSSDFIAICQSYVDHNFLPQHLWLSVQFKKVKSWGSLKGFWGRVDWESTRPFWADLNSWTLRNIKSGCLESKRGLVKV